MNALPDLAGPLAQALAAAQARAAGTIAAEVPADVSVAIAGDTIVLTGRALSLRALTDPRLRDFAGLVR